MKHPEPKRWTADEDAVLRQLYPTTPSNDVAAAMGRSRNSVNLRAQKLGITKAPGYVPPNRFEPGHTPWHRGKKRPWAKVPRSAFKPGQEPHNKLPIGSYRISDSGYLDRKVADTGYSPRDWQPVHRLVWQAAHGPIPKTHCVAFLDGMHTTVLELITVDRLECIPKGVHNGRNWHWQKYPREVAELVHLRGTLNRKINQARKKERSA